MMPPISFSGVTSRGPFYTPILRGEKLHTCRKPRKRPIKIGDQLYLYWKCRVPEHLKPIHLIGRVTCTSVERKKYSEFAYINRFAREDGFKDCLELQEWFGDPEENGDDLYDVIWWNPGEMSVPLFRKWKK